MKLALIAGRGGLPTKIAGAQPQPPLVCALTGTVPDTLMPEIYFRLETLGSLLIDLGARGITHVCFAGAIDRPQLDPAALDAETAPLVPMFQKAMAAGDNGALQILKEIFEQTGFTVLGADELLPDLVAPPGVMSEAWPDAQMRRDGKRGEAVLAAMSPLDIGQGCVVANDQVLAVEAAGGTDHMLATLPAGAAGKRAVLCKGPKIGQIREIDMPTIGPATVEAVHKAGLAGIIVDAGDVIVLEPETCTQLANQYGLVLWSRRGGET